VERSDTADVIFAIRPTCSNINLLLTAPEGYPEPIRRCPIYQPVGIACPDLTNPDPLIDVVQWGPETPPLCVECPLNDLYVLDPNELGIGVGGSATYDLSGRFVTKGIVDPDPPLTQDTTCDVEGGPPCEPGFFNPNADYAWCLGTEDGRVDLTPFDEPILSTPVTFVYPWMIQIDIKPGDGTNTINLGSNGNIPVAILSSATFDATKVDPYSVTLAGATVQVKGKASAPMASKQDVNGDGLIDLLVHVNTEALQLSDGATEAFLRGKLLSTGKIIMGSDVVKVVPATK
jgi:hypothetical protein